MKNMLADDLIKQLREHDANPNNESIAIRISRELIPVLTKYRCKVVADDGKRKCESWGVVAEKLIRAADALITERAKPSGDEKRPA